MTSLMDKTLVYVRTPDPVALAEWLAPLLGWLKPEALPGGVAMALDVEVTEGASLRRAVEDETRRLLAGCPVIIESTEVLG